MQFKRRQIAIARIQSIHPLVTTMDGALGQAYQFNQYELLSPRVMELLSLLAPLWVCPRGSQYDLISGGWLYRTANQHISGKDKVTVQIIEEATAREWEELFWTAQFILPLLQQREEHSTGRQLEALRQQVPASVQKALFPGLASQRIFASALGMSRQRLFVNSPSCTEPGGMGAAAEMSPLERLRAKHRGGA